MSRRSSRRTHSASRRRRPGGEPRKGSPNSTALTPVCRCSACSGRSGLSTRLLDRTNAEVADLVVEASRQGWLIYKSAGAVVEVTFPGLLKPPDGEAGHVPD